MKPLKVISIIILLVLMPAIARALGTTEDTAEELKRLMQTAESEAIKSVPYEKASANERKELVENAVRAKIFDAVHRQFNESQLRADRIIESCVLTGFRRTSNGNALHNVEKEFVTKFMEEMYKYLYEDDVAEYGGPLFRAGIKKIMVQN
jgi:cell division ATPase FtsA